MISPGVSACPANIEPIIHIEAPKRTDLAISPLVLIPPSATIGLRAPLAQRRRAANCQPPVPKPVLTLVMQALPGPIPTFSSVSPGVF